MSEQRAWLVRAGKFGEREKWALTQGFNGGGFHEVADLSAATAKETVAEIVRQGFPDAAQRKITNFTAQLWALRSRMSIGDLVVLPLKTHKTLAIGRIAGDYEYRTADEPDLRHVRPVKWLRDDLARSVAGQDLLHSLGAFSTICEVSRNDAAWRIAQLLKNGTDPGARVGHGGQASTGTQASEETAAPDTVASDVDVTEIDVEQYARDRLVSYIIETYAGYRMQNLVATVLEAEGFHCTVPPPGPDGGIDVLAGTGPLGLDAPQLVVQVKTDSTPVGAPVVQQLLGALKSHQASQGLLVAWSGVTKPARQEAAKHPFTVRVWDANDLLEAIFRTYHRLSEEIRTELPLKQVWTLVEEAS